MNQKEYTEKFNYIIEFIKSRDTKNKENPFIIDHVTRYISMRDAEDIKIEDQKIFTCNVDDKTACVFKREYPFGGTVIIGKLEFYNDIPQNRLRQELFQTCFDYVKSVDIAEELFEF